MIDQNGFRENVGIVLVNSNKDVFWGEELGQVSGKCLKGE